MKSLGENRNKTQSKQAKIVERKNLSQSTTTPNYSHQTWTPPTFTAFKLLLSARLCAAIWGNITDCDEVFNYWEPLHFLLHGYGFQTWEYSPDYAIRSYAYLWIHALPLKIYSAVLFIPKILQFFILRFFLSFACTLCEIYFYKSVLSAFGGNIARLTLAFLIMSCGMFISSTAFLPSSFTMYTVMLAFGGWMSKDYPIAVLGTAAGTLLGWPFVAALGIPIAYDLVIRKRSLWWFIKWAFFAAVVFLIPCVWIDTYYFGGIVIAPMNIIFYNIFTEHGPDIYGVEPGSFYFINGFLNFNVAFLLALISLPLAVMMQWLVGKPRGLPQWLPLSALAIWGLIFFTQPHKEERFLFPVYPLICFAAATALDSIQKLFAALMPTGPSNPSGPDYIKCSYWISVITCVIYGLLSASRGLAVYRGYHAPMDVYQKFTEIAQDPSIHTLPPEKPVHVCVGKEWYRFPSHFFLPDDKWHLQFIKSEFRGLLPKPYESGSDATRIRPSHMNDVNKEEPSRYVPISKCHYLVDLDLPQESEFEPRYSQNTKDWTVVESFPFLDSSRSHRFFRAFYIPFISESHCSFVNYNILKTTRTKRTRLP